MATFLFENDPKPRAWNQLGFHGRQERPGDLSKFDGW
jgi:hypothetical protein